MSLNGRRVAILVAQQYEDLELWYPKLRLEEAGATVVLVGLGDKTYLSKHGYPADTDATVDDLSPADFDGVIVPGGWAPDFLRRSDAIKKFVNAVADRGGVVAAICHGGWVLASAGLVSGRRLTSVVAIKDDMVNAGAEWVDAPVVVDGTLITSRTPRDLPSFMPAVLAVLEEQAHQGSKADWEARTLVDEDLVAVSLTGDSAEYMLDMLIRMPAAKAYKEGTTLAGTDPVALLRDFVTLSDPRGTLEAEAPVVVDVDTSGSTWRARGNLRTVHVLQGADVPGVTQL
ncbi:MAG: type 1 glutamine amidotransferase domain-containing protein [Thermoleophilia bacterium]